MYEIKTANSENRLTADFFIIAKGDNAGMPVMDATPNCFAVTTNKDVLYPKYFYYFVLNAYNKGVIFKRGSVIPFVTKDSLKADLNKEMKIVFSSFN